VLLLPVVEDAVGGLAELLVAVREGSVDHGELVGVGADGLEVALLGDQAVGGADEGGAQRLVMACTHQSCHR
jgi:hypothetical protein